MPPSRCLTPETTKDNCVINLQVECSQIYFRNFQTRVFTTFISVTFKYPVSVNVDTGIRFSLKLRVFWDVLPRSQIDFKRHFRDACCLHHQGDHSSPWWWRQHAPLKRPSTSIWLCGSTSQKTLNFTPWEPEISHRFSLMTLHQMHRLFNLLWYVSKMDCDKILTTITS
jgi:hypothetical protein